MLSTQLSRVAPWLSSLDPLSSDEGALDPLGLYTIADQLALKLCPGVRERQTHPGYLVPMAVGAFLCDEFPQDRLSVDGKSGPIQVYEWYVVESMVRTWLNSEHSDRLLGLPGREKVSDAIRRRIPISADNYLKTPSVFGFFGVYRLLARKLGILTGEDAARPGPACMRVLAAWEAETSGAAGFSSGSLHPLRKALRDAIDYGLEHGHTRPNWPHAKQLAELFNLNRPGPKVVKTLWSLLLDDTEGFRTEYLTLLTSKEFKVFVNTNSERSAHKLLGRSSSAQMSALLNGIEAYETFARLLTDAFEDILYVASARGASPAELAQRPAVQHALPQLAALRERLISALEQQEMLQSFKVLETVLYATGSAGEFVDALLSHHDANQRRKPPNGKLPWIERLESGQTVTRPNYRRDKPAAISDEYVHAYRLKSLVSFASDLRRI